MTKTEIETDEHVNKTMVEIHEDIMEYFSIVNDKLDVLGFMVGALGRDGVNNE